MISHFRHLRTFSSQLSNNRRQLSSFTSIIPIQSNVNHEVTRKLSSVVCYTDHSKQKLLSVANLRHLTSQIYALRSFSSSSDPTLEINVSLQNENMIILQLPSNITGHQARKYFSKYGTIKKLQIYYTDSRILCVVFTDVKAVNNVLNSGPHYFLYNRIGDKQDLDVQQKYRKQQTDLGNIVETVVANAHAVRPLGPKNKVPQFQGNAVVNGELKTISYKDYEKKWLILFFYPLDSTSECPTEIIAFSDKAKEFRALNCEIVACSCDRNEGGFENTEIPVLSGFSKKVAREFGVLDKNELCYRGLFLIDPNGYIRYSVVNDIPGDQTVNKVMRVLKAFQFTDKHGGVRSADWDDDSER